MIVKTRFRIILCPVHEAESEGDRMHVVKLIPLQSNWPNIWNLKVKQGE